MRAGLVAALVGFHAPLPAQPPKPMPKAASSTVPFVIRMSSGSPRVIVQARFNGHPMAMMVHSNADFFAQLRHGQAAAFGVRLVPGRHRAYGIDRDGHVSGLGRDEGVVADLTVGETSDRNAPVSVFEVPQKALAMLGLRWITSNRVVVDFGRRRLIIAPTSGQEDDLARDLKRRGYVALPMVYDAKLLDYSVMATVDGVTRRMTVATASPFLLDTEFAKAAAVRIRRRDHGFGNGPTGTRVPDYDFGQPVRVMIGGWTSPAIAIGQVQDIYGYIAEKRPADPASALGGFLGGAFLQRTGAVVDFGSRTLYVRG